MQRRLEVSTYAVEFKAYVQIRLRMYNGSSRFEKIGRGKNFNEDLLTHGKWVGQIEDTAARANFRNATVNA
jgi:hypothetical protein